MLETGSRVRLTATQVDCDVLGLLGEGAQGAVYLATVCGGQGTGGRDIALKWYLPHAATDEQWQALTMLVGRGSPGDRFLWPLDLARAHGVPAFGYAMSLRPVGYAGLSDLMAGRVDVGFRVVTTLGLELADSFLELHNDGLCYRDISFGNTFFDPATGAALICDNDNVGIDGQGPGSVRGTPYFMAPEVVRGDAAPSARTDLFSLAVLLFYLFTVHHPLEGTRALDYDCWDPAALSDLFGARPVFVFDPDDDSNRPVPGLHDNVLASWPVLPSFLRALFVRAFTEGVRDPVNGRVRESEWRSAMANARDGLMYCQGCGSENFFDGDPRTCWSCGRVVETPPRLRFGRHVVVLNHDTRLYAHHLERNYDFETPVAEVDRHPSEPDHWGLRNLSSDTWSVSSPEGERSVRPGRAVTLRAGLHIGFGPKAGAVEIG